MLGRTLAHYKIMEKLGSGGMGDVYLAEDTELERKVALKVLPHDLAESEERRARFKREAKAVAALNHPNIVTVHSIEEADGVHFLTMELVQGKTLAELLPSEGFFLDRFFDIATPLVDAVAAAHAQGIVHRDLKPRNVMLAENDRVKVLDFGLVKRTGGFGRTEGATELPTEAKTEDGVVVGTVRYMSPEQAAGKAVDARSDIFSLGIVLYEMLTGRHPFEGDTQTEILSSILKDVPAPVSEIRAGVPRELSRLVRRCLSKDPSRRWQSALDIRNELEELRREVDSGELFAEARPLPKDRGRLGSALWLGGAAIAITVLLRLSNLLSTEPVPLTLPRLENPIQITAAAGVENHPTWSPDGGRIAYDSDRSGNLDIWVTQATGGAAANFTADHRGFDRSPAWSPDGSEIAFVSERDGGGIYSMPAIGGLPTKLSSASSPTSSPVWSRDGAELAYIVVESVESFIEIVSRVSRESRRLRIPGDSGNRYDLSWSPDPSLFAYVQAVGRGDDASQLWVLRASDGTAFPVQDGSTGDWCPLWAQDGRTLFFLSNRGGSMDLWQRPIAADGTPEGESVRLTVGVGMQHAALTLDGRKLAYSKGRSVANVWRAPILGDREAAWADVESITSDQALISSLDLSADGERLVVESDRSGSRDLWIVNADGNEMRQVTTHRASDRYPRWSPDGKRVAYASSRNGNWDIWVTPVDGGPSVAWTDHPGSDLSPSWSPDGREIAFHSNRTGSSEIFVAPAAGGEPRQITRDGAQSFQGQWSPDGAWIAFSSNREDGVRRIWRLPASGGPPQRVTDSPGTWFRWSPDGKRIYFKPAWNITELWVVIPESGIERAATRFLDKPGQFGNFAVGNESIYFTWTADLGDIWVMDLVPH